MGTVGAEGQRDALPWTDITLSTSYNKCQEWTSGWTSSMNKCTGRRQYAFLDPCVMVSFLCCDMYCHLSQYWALLFLATMNKCTELRKYVFLDPCLLDRLQKVCICGPMCNGLFFMLWYVLPHLTVLDKCTELRKYVLPDPCLLDFFLVLVGTITSQNT